MTRMVENILKAWDEARIVGEQKVEDGEITWDQFQFCMIGFELQLQSMGVEL